jgi:cytochrome P450
MSASHTRMLRLSDLPAPPGLPWLGQMLQVDSERFHEQLEAWRQTCGDLFRVRIGPREFMVVADPEAIAAALRDRPGAIGRSERVVSVAREMGFEGLFASNGETWRRQRTMVMAGFDPHHIKSYFPALVKVTERFAGRWRRAAERGEAIDLQSDLMRYTVDVIAGLAFGVDINTLEKDDDVIQRHLDRILPALFRRLLAPVAYWRLVKLPADRRVDGHLAELHKAVRNFIAQARERMAADPMLRERPQNLIEAMIAARDAQASGLDDEDVAGNVLTMLLAGEDTTANTLAWMIHLLMTHPEALAHARDEVRGALGGDGLPTCMDQMARLDYVEACAHETMRLKPVAPIMLQQAHKDTVVAGVEMPEGSLMIFLMRGGALSERHFPDPHRFDPTRWLAGGADPSSAKRVAMPFGAGPRICPGRYLALLEMKMAIAMLLGSFDVLSVDTPDGAPARERLALTMSPVGLRMRLAARTPTTVTGH